ncbi:MAG: hypothetical protein RL318_868 [Fibrobacterota bacterium]|jgi:signal transduction histidine kinase
MGDILLPFQIRLLRQTFLQVLIVVGLQWLVHQFIGASFRTQVTLGFFFALSLLAWLTTNEKTRPRALVYFAVMEFALLVAPWYLGGVRRPAAYFCLILLHPLALLFGLRAAWIAVAAFVLNVILLMAAEMNGFIASVPPTAVATMLTLTAMIGYTLFFIASPLVYIRRLFEVASHHLDERRKVDDKLVALAQELESRVQERSAELLLGRGRLQDLALENAQKLAEEIELLRGAVTRIEEVFASDSTPKVAKSLDRIRRAQDRIERMHDALVRFCHLAGKPPRLQGVSAIEHKDLVQSVWDELSERNGNGAGFSLEDLPACKADPDLLRHVWQNLLSNAIKYSSQHAHPCVEVFLGKSGICVRDNGVGFDSGNAENLFGLFQRLHPASEFAGTGVGLAIVHRIIEMHGGTIRALSVPGEGATFQFSLPLFHRPESESGLAPVRVA